MSTLEQIKTALREFGACPFQDHSSYPLPRAQRALEGRTHYVEDGTLKYFGARINSCRVSHDGLYLYLLESVAHPSMGRVHRAVVFDVFGTVLTPRVEFLRKTSKAARRDLDAFLATFDPITHTETALRAAIAHKLRECTDALAALDSTDNN